MRDGEKHPDKQQASNGNGGKGDKDLLCQGVFKIIADFLEGKGQADSNRVLPPLVQDGGKPEVCEDVKGGGEESKEEVVEDIVPASGFTSLGDESRNSLLVVVVDQLFLIVWHLVHGNSKHTGIDLF